MKRQLLITYFILFYYFIENTIGGNIFYLFFLTDIKHYCRSTINTFLILSPILFYLTAEFRDLPFRIMYSRETCDKHSVI